MHEYVVVFSARVLHVRDAHVACADLNYLKRYQSTDLSGKVALVTGARVKIGGRLSG